MSVKKTRNDDVDWSKFDPATYIDHHYHKVASHDRELAQGIIRLLTDKLPDQRYGSLTEIGTGGVMRTACLLAPLLTPDASVTLTDVAKPQLAATRHVVSHVQKGEPEDWAAHVAYMAAANPRWTSALARICEDPIIRPHNILKTPLGSSALRIEAHCLCSISAVAEEYNLAATNFYAGMQPQDVAVRIFDIGSKGYFVGTEWFPGYAVHPADARQQAERAGLAVLGDFSVPFRDDADPEGSPSTMSAIGVMISVKP